MNEIFNYTPDGFTAFLIGLLNKGEWKTLLIAIILTFSITYIVKLIYMAIIHLSEIKFPNHIRVIAIISGFVSSYIVWPDDMFSMDWYQAGLLIGPGSILVYHTLMDIFNMKFFKTHFPLMSKILKAKKVSTDDTKE